jgi:hypothetical protein
MKLAAALLALGAATPEPPVYVVRATVWSGGTGSGLWTPTNAEARDAISALERYVRALPSTKPVKFSNARSSEISVRFDSLRPDHYLFQVEGVRPPTKDSYYGTESAGRKLIHIDGYCASITSDPNIDISRSMLDVDDGGACVIHAMFDPAHGTITNFETNGQG